MLNRHTLLLALNDVEDADLERTRRSLKLTAILSQ